MCFMATKPAIDLAYALGKRNQQNIENSIKFITSNLQLSMWYLFDSILEGRRYQPNTKELL